jgi:hypothetical protein
MMKGKRKVFVEKLIMFEKLERKCLEFKAKEEPIE